MLFVKKEERLRGQVNPISLFGPYPLTCYDYVLNHRLGLVYWSGHRLCEAFCGGVQRTHSRGVTVEPLDQNSTFKDPSSTGTLDQELMLGKAG